MKDVLRVRIFTRVTFWLAGFLAAAAFQSGPVFAQEAEPESAVSVRKVGVVDLGRLFDNYQRTSASEKDLEKISTEKKAQRERLTTEIRKLRDELILLNDENRNKQRQIIEEKLQGLAAFDQDVKSTLSKKRDETIQSILSEIERVVSAYSKDEGFDMILSSQAVLFGVEKLDVTDKILSVLNQRYAKKR